MDDAEPQALISLRPLHEGIEVQMMAGEFMIGRSTFGVADKYCSRKQAMILIDDSGEITITPKGTNPMQLKKKGELEFAVIPAGSTQLEPGDIFTLYHKKHPIRVALIPRPLKSMSDITPGLCVWFKHPGYPYWPARIAMEREIGPGVKKKKGVNTHLIFFFGTHDYSWVRFPNEMVQENETKRRRSSSKAPVGEPDRDLSCRCFCFVSSAPLPVSDQSEEASRKRKRPILAQYPIHLYSCKEFERRKGSKNPEFLKACEEANLWVNQDPEEWFFKEFDPAKDSDDEDSGPEIAATGGGGGGGGEAKDNATKNHKAKRVKSSHLKKNSSKNIQSQQPGAPDDEAQEIVSQPTNEEEIDESQATDNVEEHQSSTVNGEEGEEKKENQEEVGGGDGGESMDVDEGEKNVSTTEPPSSSDLRETQEIDEEMSTKLMAESDETNGPAVVEATDQTVPEKVAEEEGKEEVEGSEPVEEEEEEKPTPPSPKEDTVGGDETEASEGGSVEETTPSASVEESNQEKQGE